MKWRGEIREKFFREIPKTYTGFEKQISFSLQRIG